MPGIVLCSAGWAGWHEGWPNDSALLKQGCCTQKAKDITCPAGAVKNHDDHGCKGDDMKAVRDCCEAPTCRAWTAANECAVGRKRGKDDRHKCTASGDYKCSAVDCCQKKCVRRCSRACSRCC